MEETDPPQPIAARLAAYMPRSEQTLNSLVNPVFAWLQTNRQRDKIQSAELDVGLRVGRSEDEILAHFAGFVGGPDFKHKDEAWRLA